MTPVK